MNHCGPKELDSACKWEGLQTGCRNGKRMANRSLCASTWNCRRVELGQISEQVRELHTLTGGEQKVLRPSVSPSLLFFCDSLEPHNSYLDSDSQTV